MYRDSWKNNDDDCSPDQLATKYNLWLRLDGKWYTPKEFKEWFGGGNPARYRGVELLNPLWALREARKAIDNNIISDCTSTLILDQLRKFHIFTDRIFKEGFKTISGQLDFMSWPAPANQPNVTVFHPPTRENPADDHRMNA